MPLPRRACVRDTPHTDSWSHHHEVQYLLPFDTALLRLSRAGTAHGLFPYRFRFFRGLTTWRLTMSSWSRQYSKSRIRSQAYCFPLTSMYGSLHKLLLKKRRTPQELIPASSPGLQYLGRLAYVPIYKTILQSVRIIHSLQFG